MKVSWRLAGETPGTLQHFYNFAPREQYEGRNLREFMIYLIRQTHTSEIALNDKVVWGLKDGYNAEEIVFRALVPPPRLASVLYTVDYTTQGDWIDSECRACGSLIKCEHRATIDYTAQGDWVDSECRACGCLYGTHRQCKLMSDIDAGWLDVVGSAHGS